MRVCACACARARACARVRVRRVRAWMGACSKLEARWITLAASTLGEHVSKLGTPALSLSNALLSSHSGLAARLRACGESNSRGRQAVA